ncbi:hypothetical protein VTL71DRAFT_11924 [Oculimacula yallundae]|uniref:Uncharacterized protein n=1 Tax=Oculimacula yallundae TaxID=86028 RepID=A0ABR4CRI0_9HELO
MPTTDVELESNNNYENNIMQDCEPNNGISSVNTLNSPQDILPLIVATPERESSNIVEQASDDLPGAISQGDLTTCSDSQIEDSLDDSTPFEREGAPSPAPIVDLDDFDWVKFFSIAERRQHDTGAHPVNDSLFLPSPSPEMSTLPGQLKGSASLVYDSGSARQRKDRVLLSPNPSPRHTPMISKSSQTNFDLSSPTSEPTFGFNASRPAMIVDAIAPARHNRSTSPGVVNFPPSTTHEINGLQHNHEAATSNAQLQIAASAAIEEAGRRRRLAMRLGSRIPENFCQPIQRRPQNPTNRIITNRVRKQPIKTTSSPANRDNATLRIKMNNTGETMIFTGPKNMIPTVIWQGPQLQV